MSTPIDNIQNEIEAIIGVGASAFTSLVGILSYFITRSHRLKKQIDSSAKNDVDMKSDIAKLKEKVESQKDFQIAINNSINALAIKIAKIDVSLQHVQTEVTGIRADIKELYRNTHTKTV